MKAVVAAFNQEKALVGAFSVLTNLRMELFQALVASGGTPRPGRGPAQLLREVRCPVTRLRSPREEMLRDGPGPGFLMPGSNTKMDGSSRQNVHIQGCSVNPRNIYWVLGEGPFSNPKCDDMMPHSVETIILNIILELNAIEPTAVRLSPRLYLVTCTNQNWAVDKLCCHSSWE